MAKRILSAGVLTVLAVIAAACTVHQTEPPPLTGPSEFALALVVTATPDTINQDGGSQSSIRVTARGPNGEPLSGVPIRLDMAVNGVPQDFGTLSARTLVTGSDGTALAVFTAPPAGPINSTLGTCQGLPGTCLTIVATPTGNNFVAANPQSVQIRLAPTGVILPPAATPVASFTFSPSAPEQGLPVAFDGSPSCPESGATTGGCSPSSHTITSFAWEFGDGTTGSGKTVSHTFNSASTFNVTLTVTNDRGLASSKTQQVTVGTATAPTAGFVFGPTPVNVGVQTNFDGSASKAATGHSIVQYQWNWGDGDPVERRGGPFADHDFNAAGTYQVTLTVTDDTGQTASANQSVTVGSGAPTATLTVTKTGGNSVFADGNGSSANGSATIVDYTFNWGEPGVAPESGSAASRTHTFGAAGTYTVRLTVRDNLGRTGTTTQSVTVP